ncbi:hypothetical protein AOLI_G00309600 [Acnodon oligacanthus]
MKMMEADEAKAINKPMKISLEDTEEEILKKRLTEKRDGGEDEKEGDELLKMKDSRAEAESICLDKVENFTRIRLKPVMTNLLTE